MSALILTWPKHFRKRCNCVDIERACCVLFTCAVCGGTEATLPTDCPGERMSIELQDAVLHATVDYDRHRGWFNPRNGERLGSYKD